MTASKKFKLSSGSGFSKEKGNPYSEYNGSYDDFFFFGDEYVAKVTEVLIEGIGCDKGNRNDQFLLMDVGAGTGYWSDKIIRKAGISVIVVEPSDAMLAGSVAENRSKFEILRFTAQDLAREVEQSLKDLKGKVNCIMFMQSAHYIHSDEFASVMIELKKLLCPSGHLLFQARNMSEDWWPWPVPNSWASQIKKALVPLYMLADRYESQLLSINGFAKISKWSRELNISVPLDDYLYRLSNRWIPSIMNSAVINDHLLNEGINEMRQEYLRKETKEVSWRDSFVLVSAQID